MADAGTPLRQTPEKYGAAREEEDWKVSETRKRNKERKKNWKPGVQCAPSLPNPSKVDVTTDAVTNDSLRKANVIGGELIEREEENCI
jgi:hypothetical protein